MEKFLIIFEAGNQLFRRSNEGAARILKGSFYALSLVEEGSFYALSLVEKGSFYALSLIEKGSFYALSFGRGLCAGPQIEIVKKNPKAAEPPFSPVSCLFGVRVGVRVRVWLRVRVRGWVYASTSIRPGSAFWLANANSPPPQRSGRPTS